MSGSASYCSGCLSLDYEQMSSPEGQLYHASYNSLVVSASSGCELCAFFIDPRHIAGHLYDIPATSHDHPVHLQIVSLPEHRSLRLCLKLSGVEHPPLYALYVKANVRSEPRSIPLALLTHSSQNHGNDDYFRSFEFAREWDRSSDTAINKMKNWIIDCCSAHADCGTFSVPLPTRILDLSPDGDYSSSRLRLIPGQDLIDQYVALSHCWGAQSSVNNAKFVHFVQE